MFRTELLRQERNWQLATLYETPARQDFARQAISEEESFEG